MPTNFIKNLKRPVILKPGQKCCWERHMGWGTAARSLWRTLEKLDSVRTDRFCFVDGIKSIQKLTAKFKGGKRVGSYSYDAIQNLIVDYRAEGLISVEFENDEGDYRGMFGFLVAGQDQHDALCRREGRTCRYIGWDNLPPTIKLGQHYPDSMFFANEKDLEVKPENTQSGTQPGTTQNTQSGPRVSTQSGTQESEKRYPSRYPMETPQEPQSQQLQHSHKSLVSSIGAPNHLSHSIIGSKESLEAVESAVLHSQVALSEDERQNIRAGILPSSLSMTDQTQKPESQNSAAPAPRRAESAPAIRAVLGAPLTIREVTDGEIDPDKIQWDYWDRLAECCDYEVEHNGGAPYRGRKTLGDIMAVAMVQFTQRYGEKPPPAWYFVAKKFRAYAPAQVSTSLADDSATAPAPYVSFASADEKDIWDRALESGVITFQQFKAYAFGPGAILEFEPRHACCTYADGWRFLAGLKDLPAPLVKVRDWFQEKSASETPLQPRG